MILLGQFVCLLATHWVADFVCQTSWQATNKSKNNIALGCHVLTYTGVLAIASFLLFGFTLPAVCFVVLNGLLHFVTDYITSRISSKLYAKQDWHNFFVIVGMDQLIHQITLALTLISII